MISIVIPLLNEAGNLELLHQKLTETLSSVGQPYEMIFVDDGSNDDSPQILRSLFEQDSAVTVIQFRQNFGKTAALTAGFRQSRGDSDFDRFDNGQARQRKRFRNRASLTFERAIRWLEAAGPSTRFFLFLHTYEVHSPYTPAAGRPLDLANRLTPGNTRTYDGVERELGIAILSHDTGERLVSRRDIARLRALYVGEIAGLDAQVGRLLGTLRRLGVERDTLVILTADHGEEFGEWGKVGHASSLHNRTLHVPLAFRWPGRIRSGSARVPVELVDLLPTVLDLTGQPLPEGLDGRSLAGLIDGRELPDGSESAFSEQRADREFCAGVEPLSACSVGRYAVQTRRFKYVSSRVPRFEKLFDLESDPLESRDVSRLYPDELARHRRLLAARLGESSPAEKDAPAGAQEVDAETRERLEALGYLD